MKKKILLAVLGILTCVQANAETLGFDSVTFVCEQTERANSGIKAVVKAITMSNGEQITMVGLGAGITQIFESHYETEQSDELNGGCYLHYTATSDLTSNSDQEVVGKIEVYQREGLPRTRCAGSQHLYARLTLNGQKLACYPL